MGRVVDLKEFEKVKATKEVVDALQKLAIHATNAEFALRKLQLLLTESEFKDECEKRGIDFELAKGEAECVRHEYLNARKELEGGA